ncbi:hypothetical protein IQ06DRAFT_311249 [Phaeosphaeriaceae sp. SRC1lsM3a]|nr:hypothetical protein IQ06DRAFT_311249 [Stagonospora sp. SRC1lsM3a]
MVPELIQRLQHTVPGNVRIGWKIEYKWARGIHYITELREQIVENTNADGRVDISKLYKLEACIRETLRMSPPQTNAPQRRALKDVVLKDGVVVLKGALPLRASRNGSLDIPRAREVHSLPQGKSRYARDYTN